MTVAAGRSTRRRASRRLGRLAMAAGVLVAPAAVAPPAGAAALGWDVRWSAPVTTTGPNGFAAAPEVAGTALPPLGLGNPTKVAYSVAVPAGFPGACAVPAGTAALKGRAFTVKPALTCNGTYMLSVVASKVLTVDSAALGAPILLADPGPAPAAPRGAITGRRVTLSWAADPDTDVVGYRLRRNGHTVAEPARGEGAFIDTVPAAGSYTHDVQVLRWGAGGPGSASIASPPSAPATATVVDDAAPSGVGAGPGTGSGTGGTAPSASPGTGAGPGTGSLPGVATAAPKAPTPGRSSGPSGSGSTYRSGGVIASGSDARATTGTAEPDTFAERLPYPPRDTGRTVELASPDTTRTVARTTTTPGTTRPGLLVPLAVVLVLVATSLQILALLRRTAPAGIELEPPALEG